MIGVFFKWENQFINEEMKLKELYLSVKKEFINAAFESPETEARVLIAEILNIDKGKIYSNPDMEIGYSLYEELASAVQRRIKGEPSAYITGKKEFFSKSLVVNSDVLIPREETEILVEESLDILKSMKKPNILDVGTGSGCISIIINSEINAGLICASDISFAALQTAKKNLQEFSGLNKINFIQGNLLECFKSSSFDIIISNPPYISESESDSLQKEVRDFEPKESLFSSDGGLYHIKKIILESKIILRNEGWCIMEVGYHQSNDVKKLFEQSGYSKIGIIKDLNGIERIVKAQWKK